MIPDIQIKDYRYDLPEGRIAKYPLSDRDSSKLLRYSDGKVDEHVFTALPELLPEGALMIFNDTKVVPARLHFCRRTGAHVEVFCLRPESPSDYAQSFGSRESCVWKCVIGNSKRCRDGEELYLFIPVSDGGDHQDIVDIGLTATILKREAQTGLVKFTWKGGKEFSTVLDMCGNIPIPPYLNRDTEPIDLERYQTTYAHIRGSVAAPTAGLHFTDSVLEAIRRKGIEEDNVCLHVGAGTFLPVKSDSVADHPMHLEPFVVSRELLKKLSDASRGRSRKIIAVGTTSMRTLESLYYVGVSCIEKGYPEEVHQWAPYERQYGYECSEALDAIIDYLDANSLSELKVGTRIIIVPGFRFRLVDVLVTNFHQSESTLLLLVSAFVGGDWRTIYDYAISNGFRFLSYGDSSVLFRRDI